MTSKNPVALARTFWQLGTGYVGARNLLKGVEPLAVIGFGDMHSAADHRRAQFEDPDSDP